MMQQPYIEFVPSAGSRSALASYLAHYPFAACLDVSPLLVERHMVVLELFAAPKVRDATGHHGAAMIGVAIDLAAGLLAAAALGTSREWRMFGAQIEHGEGESLRHAPAAGTLRVTACREGADWALSGGQSIVVAVDNADDGMFRASARVWIEYA